MATDAEARLALWSYFEFSQVMHVAADAVMASRTRVVDRVRAPDLEGIDRAELVTIMARLAYWYASLYVVIEGWKVLKLTDPAIDAEVNSPYVDTLRLFRNGVFHYQRSFDDHRFENWMINAPAEAFAMVLRLERAFDAYFRRHVHRAEC